MSRYFLGEGYWYARYDFSETLMTNIDNVSIYYSDLIKILAEEGCYDKGAAKHYWDFCINNKKLNNKFIIYRVILMKKFFQNLKNR